MKCYIHEKTREDAERVRDRFLSLGLIKSHGDIIPKDRRLRDGRTVTEYWIECEE